MDWLRRLVPIAGVTGIFYATLIEPYRLTITRIDLPLKNLPPEFDGFTLAHISDIHVGSWSPPPLLAEWMQEVSALNADVIVVTGDYVIKRLRPEFLQQLRDALRFLKAREGVYGVLGNHDYKKDVYVVRREVEAGGVNLLENRHIVFRRGDAALYLAGVEDVLRGNPDLHAALEGIPSGACIVLLAHEPDFANQVARDRRVALQLSGHSHGGQVRIPFLGAVYSQLPRLARRYIMGVYRIKNLTLYVTRGLGMVRPFVRFNCPPEIVYITLRREHDDQSSTFS